MEKTKSWFELWFNSPYYHVLYKNRDEAEARIFLDKLLDTLAIPTGSNILDLACGKGRHAYYLAQNGFEVTGLDISENSIEYALEKYRSGNPEFYVHDMRNPFRINFYDYIFNFFTSFGYFDNFKDNEKVFEAIHLGLKPGGKVLIDFMNADKVVSELGEREEKEIDGIRFYIRREYENDIIYKHINFESDSKVYNFTEKVQALKQSHFHDMAAKTGFKLLKEYGSYALDDFDLKKSPRYILLLEK